MLELLIGFDYQTIQQALWAGYIMTLVFPLAAVYFLNTQSTKLNHKHQALIQAKHARIPINFDRYFDYRMLQAFFTKVRQRSAPDDSDKANLLDIV